MADPANLTTLGDYYKYYKDKDTASSKFTDTDTIVLETNSAEKKTVAYYPNLAGYYVYCKSSQNSLSSDGPSTDNKCPEPNCKAAAIYSAETGAEFRLAVSANCDPKDGNYIQSIDAGTKKYKLYLAKNQSFY